MKKIKMGVIGAGNCAAVHCKSVYEGEFTKLVMACDVSEERRKEFVDKYKLPCAADYREVLANREIEAISVAVPDQLHCEIVCAALKAGKHVLCEKPMALNLDECKKMLEVSRETGKELMIGQVCRFTPSFVKAKELVDAGEIGELVFIEGEYAHDYSKMAPGNWRTSKERHGLIGGGCHSVDYLRWVAGDPLEVFGYGSHKMLKNFSTDDCTIAVLKFPDNVLGKVFCSTGCKRNYTMRTAIYGTKGTIVMDNTSDYMTLFKEEFNGEETLFGSSAKTVKIELPVEVNNHNIQGEVNSFARGIAENGKPEISGKEGAQTIAVCTAIINSVKSGSPEKVDYNF